MANGFQVNALDTLGILASARHESQSESTRTHAQEVQGLPSGNGGGAMAQTLARPTSLAGEILAKRGITLEGKTQGL